MRTHTGFTLVEMVVSVGLFAIISLSIYQVILAILKGVESSQAQTAVAALADQYMEIARNLPYSQVGTLSGNPHGSLPDQPNPVTATYNGVPYQVYYVVTYTDDPADGTALAGTDPAPNDYKKVKLYVKDMATGVSTSFLTTIVPKGLENMASGGALSIKVMNAVGQGVPGATIQITNSALPSPINLTRTSDANGNWVEVGLPDSVSSYHVVVTKSGYSTDQTYPSTLSNPNPVKPDATIANGQVTAVSFAIDQQSGLTFMTLNQACQPLSGVGVEVRGAKLIGTPSVYKFDHTYASDASGNIALDPIEWDTYTPALTGSSYSIYGSSPIQQIDLLPNTSQTFSLILGPATANSLLAIVKDASTGNPIEGAEVDLHNNNTGTDAYLYTGGSVLSQSDWSGGPGQATSTGPATTLYFSDDGGVNTTGVPTGLRLATALGNYVPSGSLISSSFDTGSGATTYTTLTWQPTSQDPAASVKFQIASNNDGGTWNFIGPDGTSGSYYTVPGTTISTANNYNRYIRYKAFLSTTDPAKTPVLTSVTANYVSGCFTPGQAMFPGLDAAASYSVTVSASGYTTQTFSNMTVSGYNVLNVSL